MSSHDDEADLQATGTPGYKVSAPAKSPEEYAQMDANDESLNRWKQSLGIGAGAAADAPKDGPKVTMLTMELVSDSLPSGKQIVLDLTNTVALAEAKKNPITIKEGIEYKYALTMLMSGCPSESTTPSSRESATSQETSNSSHLLSSRGVKYLQVVKRAGVKVDKLEQMLGSYGPSDKPYVKNFNTEESPSGMIARSGTYNVRSRVIDDDGEVYSDFEWSFKLAKEW